MTDEQQDFRAMTADTIGKDLLGALVAELKLLPKPWPEISQDKQNDIIDRLRSRVGNAVKMAVHLIASEGRTVVVGDLDQITIKDGVKAVVKFGASAANLHELYDSSGKAVILVVASAVAHTGGMDEVKGEADQRGLDLGHEYHDNDGGGMMEGEVVDAEFTEDAPALPAPSEEELLQQSFEEGYQAAADGKPESDCPIIRSELVIEWIRGHKAWHEEQQTPANEDDDPLYVQAVELVIRENKVSISMVQRHLRIGYNRAARLVELMEQRGVVSAQDPTDGKRTVTGNGEQKAA